MKRGRESLRVFSMISPVLCNTSSTFMPSTWIASMSYAQAFLYISATADARSTAVPMPYLLLMQNQITGSLNTAAKLSDSWNAPTLVEPSPNMQNTTSFAFWYLIAQPAPTVHGLYPQPSA